MCLFKTRRVRNFGTKIRVPAPKANEFSTYERTCEFKFSCQLKAYNLLYLLCAARSLILLSVFVLNVFLFLSLSVSIISIYRVDIWGFKMPLGVFNDLFVCFNTLRRMRLMQRENYELLTISFCSWDKNIKLSLKFLIHE